MLTFNWICCVTVSLFMGIPFLMDPMVLATLYVWCQLNKDVIVNFWFGTQFKVRHKGNQTGYCLVVHEKSKFLLTPLIFAFQAMYLPWVLFAFNMIIAGGGIMELIGILIGHMYFFLMFKYPQDFGGPSLLSTPQFMYNWFPNQGSQFKIPTGCPDVSVPTFKADISAPSTQTRISF